MGPNQFSDLSLEEFQALPIFGYKKPEQSLPKVGVHEYNGEELPASAHFRLQEARAVPPQGWCARVQRRGASCICPFSATRSQSSPSPRLVC